MVAILMSSYNGEKYIDEQIKSIINQTFKNWILYIRDDGSTDSTLSIIKKYEYKNYNIKVINDGISRLGPSKSFFKLLSLVEAEYYMFCDQDDVWLPNKIEETLYAMQNSERATSKIPIAICSDLGLVNDKLEPIYPSMWKYTRLIPKYLTQWNYLKICNIITGCTLMINNVAKEVSLHNSDIALMHDSWIGLNVLASKGKVIAIPKQLILYRQHNQNVLGNPPKAGWKLYLEKLGEFKKSIKDIQNQYRIVNTIKRTNYINFVCYKLVYQIIRLFN